MAKLWQIKPSVPQSILEQFPELSSLQVQLLYNLNLTDPDRVDWFLTPDYHNLYDPFLFTQMQVAVDRTWEAIQKNEKILIYGDYDADAVTANAVLTQTFRYLGVEVESYIPDRFTEGYGLNLEAFQKIKDQGVKVVITVDCGTNSTAEADYCKANGIDLIITDHHEITGSIPNAFALVNPKNPNEVYPDKQITGVGVAYKFAKALLSNHEKVMTQRGVSIEDHIPEWDKWLLDLVAIGTVADCHSLLGENRILVKFGLKVLQKTRWMGLRLLMENAGIDLKQKNPDSVTLGFAIAPRINAAGRLEHANVALQLLTTNDYATAIDLANRIEEINRRRQDITARIVSEAKEKAEAIRSRKILVLSDPSWAKGVVGIVAGKLAEHYKKPVIVLERGEKESTGSARSSRGFDIVSALKACAPYLSRFGGHKEAAGLTLSNDKLDEFYVELLKYTERHWPEELPEAVLEIDAELSESDFSFDRYAEIELLEPFGAGNPKPIFAVKGATLASYRTVGADQNHLQLKIAIGEKLIDCIGFSMGYKAGQLEVGQDLDLCGELLSDSWNGTKKLKMRVIDIKLVETVDQESKVESIETNESKQQLQKTIS
ncbi:TPA: single-stranded-DNA-specific exonuclease RecJ [Patescibacteria group bacterium]|nr:single-stranded-DNA-specific exonuclease RecJ [Patescibacteria group bacterium]